jgi:hypothetical protein
MNMFEVWNQDHSFELDVEIVALLKYLESKLEELSQLYEDCFLMPMRI